MSTDTKPETADALTQPEPAWLSLLNETIGESVLSLDDRKEDLDYIIGAMVREYLVCEDDNARETFARRFDEFYDVVYVPKFNGYGKRKKGWTGYLEAFYDILLPVAMEIPYNDPKQNKVVQLFLELRKLPIRVVKVFIVSPNP